MASNRTLLFDPTSLPQKQVTRQTTGGIRRQTYYLAPCLAPANLASKNCKRERWLHMKPRWSSIPVSITAILTSSSMTAYAGTVRRMSLWSR